MLIELPIFRSGNLVHTRSRRQSNFAYLLCLEVREPDDVQAGLTEPSVPIGVSRNSVTTCTWSKGFEVGELLCSRIKYDCPIGRSPDLPFRVNLNGYAHSAHVARRGKFVKLLGLWINSEQTPPSKSATIRKQVEPDNPALVDRNTVGSAGKPLGSGQSEIRNPPGLHIQFQETPISILRPIGHPSVTVLIDCDIVQPGSPVSLRRNAFGPVAAILIYQFVRVSGRRNVVLGNHNPGGIAGRARKCPDRHWRQTRTAHPREAPRSSFLVVLNDWR